MRKIIILIFLLIISLNTKSFSAPSKIEIENLNKKFLLYYHNYGKFYRLWIKYFNPRLKEKEVDIIARSIIFYCMYFNNIDPRLVMAVIAVESNFNIYAVSNKGAEGLGQLMPFKARELGIANVSFHPIFNIYGCVRTLRGLFDRFAYLGHPRQYQFALAAYNAGAGAVEKYGGIPPYTETQNYVWKVTHIYQKLAPDMFGYR